MAAQFVGLQMRVLLRDPPGYQIMGTVRDVEAGTSLTLVNVFVAGTKDWAPEMRIDALNIADLGEVKPDTQSSSYYAPPPVEAAAAPVPVQYPQPLPNPMDDPAILSLGRPSGTTASVSSELPPSPRHLNGGELPVDDILDDSDVPGVLRGIHVGRDDRPMTPGQEMAASIEGLRIRNGTHGAGSGKPTDTEDDKSSKKRRRPRKQTKLRQDQLQEADSSPNSGAPTSGHGKGWRQTPMLESAASFQPFSSLKRNGRGRKGGNDNGWASEEVTEEMGDFDFENNLAKFDKRTIFDQMRKEDKVDDASRLVSHNRKPKPGTNGGKNLHYSENVLDLPTSIAKNTDFWNSEADDNLNGNGRQPVNQLRQTSNSRRAESKGGAKRSQSRRASGAVGSQPLSRVSSTASQAGLYLVPSKRRIEAISTLQMLNLENIAANEVGFTEDLMAENAGRGIAEVAVRALTDPATKVRFELAIDGSSADVDEAFSNSTTVILAGNNKSSIRALAGARHLRNRGFDVMVCVVGIGSERDLLEDLRRQIELYRRFGGKVLTKSELFDHLRKTAAAGVRVPVSLIIDSLLGLTISFEELRVGDQATVYELMEWANRNEASVLSIDVPSGIDPTTGKIAIIDGAPLFVKPRYVVAVGAPKRGLLEAVTPPGDSDPEPDLYPTHDEEWRLFLADMGLGSAVWKKGGSKIRRGIDFDGNWVLEMQYFERGPNLDVA